MQLVHDKASPAWTANAREQTVRFDLTQLRPDEFEELFQALAASKRVRAQGEALHE
ncbi:hypothetical protein AB0J14_34350 [Micromonospora arborensis]|uniref:hypothetical protein n=1 Tax=Micromonospora arborensis TaxID=2116518 RepID=UPI0033D42E62